MHFSNKFCKNVFLMFCLFLSPQTHADQPLQTEYNGLIDAILVLW